MDGPARIHTPRALVANEKRERVCVGLFERERERERERDKDTHTHIERERETKRDAKIEGNVRHF